MIYVVGFFGNVAQMFANTNCMRVIHWIGSDILQLKQADPKVIPGVLNWLDNNVDVHLCEFETTRLELDELGIKARIVTLPPLEMFEEKPLPKDFSVAVYLPMQNKAFYNPDLIMEIAKEMTDVKFNIFGDLSIMGEKDNIKHWGVVKGEEKQQLIDESSAIVRAVPHDGLPISVMEFIMSGRNAAVTVDMPFTYKISLDKEAIVKVINELRIKEQNSEGAKYYRELCSHDKFREAIYGLLKFDMKKWWEEFSDL
jgi:hypothetical protein